MKLCNYCQRELDDRQQICPYCGEQQEPTPIRYQRNEYTEESYSEPKRARSGQALGGVGMSLLSYFGYIRSKWSGRNVVATSGALSWLTVLLYSLFTGLLVNIVARGNFVSFLKNSLLVFVFVLVSALFSFVISKLMERDRTGIFHYFFDFSNYLILPMLLSLIGIIVGVLKAHNVAQIILFASLFFVFTAMVAKLTKSLDLNEPNHYPGLLIMSAVFVGFFLVLTRLVF